MATKSEIIWSPTSQDQFLVFDNDMTLYKLDRYAVGDIHPLSTSTLTHWVSNTSTATRLCTNRDLSHYRCFDWHPRSTDFGQDLIAIGFANGRVLLTSPSISLSVQSNSNVDAIGDPAGTTGNLPNPNIQEQREEIGTIGGIRVFGKEFVPKHSRPCQSLRWNPQHVQWLAVGLDRHRSDNGKILKILFNFNFNFLFFRYLHLGRIFEIILDNRFDALRIDRSVIIASTY